MSPWLVRHLVYPLHERLCNRRTFACLRELERTQWWSPQRLRALQAAKLGRLLAHAEQRCPYYCELFARLGLDVTAMDPFDVLARLPLLDKDTIRAHREELTWREVPGGLRQSTTGGSTGAPLIFYLDRRRQEYDKAARMRTHRWYGADVGDREVYLWGSPLEIGSQDRLKSARDRLTNELLLSAFELTPRRMTAYLDRIARYDPRCIFGYPSSLSLLCEHGRSVGRVVRPPSLAAVFVTGELLDDGQRRVIEEYFAVPVADGYGSREAGFLAHSCPHGRMHVTDENVVLEIVSDDGRPVTTGDRGEIVVTHLDAYAMPLIRYRTGDVGRRVQGKCACGRGLSCMEVVGGRRTDHLVATDGTVMHGLSLIYVLREIDAVRQFRVRQQADGSVEVCVVPAGVLDDEDRRRIEVGVRDRLGWDTRVHLRIVDRIEPAASGKFRCVTSDAVGREVQV
ncbi:MAG TPA: phenylacetate--CoA ligase family protein [Phycisphaerae bacterium]|nr:phenylacetate--CoA ligase family protein [Phycisphaerae bacterium]